MHLCAPMGTHNRQYAVSIANRKSTNGTRELAHNTTKYLGEPHAGGGNALWGNAV